MVKKTFKPIEDSGRSSVQVDCIRLSYHVRSYQIMPGGSSHVIQSCHIRCHIKLLLWCSVVVRTLLKPIKFCSVLVAILKPCHVVPHIHKFLRSLFSSNIQETRQNTFVLSKNRDERMQWAKMEVVVIIDR